MKTIAKLPNRGHLILQIIGCIIILTAASCKKNNTLLNPENKVSNTHLKVNSIDTGITHLGPPSSVSSLYSTSLNTSVSDDFNDTNVDFAKWQYRTDGTSKWDTTSSHVYIAQSGSDHFLTLKGSASDKKGSGISSKATVQYGFYIVRWEAVNWANNSPSGWHPGIWGAGCDFSSYPRGNCIPQCYAANSTVLEPDFIEGITSPDTAYWYSHMMTWHNGVVDQDVTFKPKSTTWPNTSWSILGFEYNPGYLAVWEYSSGTWTKLKQVPITSSANSQTNINSAYATPLHWIFSNYAFVPTLLTTDSWLRIDYFYDYDYIGTI